MVNNKLYSFSSAFFNSSSHADIRKRTFILSENNKTKCGYNPTTITETLHEEQNAFLRTFRDVVKYL